MRIAESRYGKLAGLVCFLLHLMVAGLVPYVDGALEAAELNREVHVEAEHGAPCAPAHDELACQFCQVLGRHLVLSADLASLPLAGAERRTAAPARVEAYPCAATRISLGPRAPPQV